VIDEVYHIGAETEEAWGEEFLTHILRIKKCFWNVWRYIYRRKFLEDNCIRFLEGSLSEDMDYTAHVYAARPKFAFFHCPYYFYNVGRGDSLMDKPTLTRLGDTVSNIKSGIKMLETANLPFSASFIEQYQFEYILCMALCVEINSEDKPEALALYDNTLDILKVGSYRTAHVFNQISRVLSVNAVAWGLHFMKVIKRKLRGDARKIINRG
jgi:hypothetical protein